MTNIPRSSGRLAAGALILIIGAAIFVDDLHDFVAGTDWLHWLPEFPPIMIGTFHLEHLYIGALIIHWCTHHASWANHNGPLVVQS
nr:MAG: hypothetical protein AM324_00285 [Candidatus Thorarchaeota archaeon SMTZ1-83]